jgi:hypothetical protein
MRTVAIVTVAAFLGIATTVRGQEPDRHDHGHRVLKVAVGAGALAAGLAIAAKSSRTTRTKSPLGITETFEFSTGQLIAGLVVASTGGFMVWDSLRDHEPSRPSTRVVLGIRKKATGVVLLRSW